MISGAAPVARFLRLAFSLATGTGFSEDIDISIDRAYLGFEGEKDPENIESRSKQKKTIDKLRDACGTKVNEEILPQLLAVVEGKLGPPVNGDQQRWNITPYEEDTDGQSLVLAYPTDVEQGVVEENPLRKAERAN